MVSKASAGVLTASEMTFFRWAIASAVLLPWSWRALMRERALLPKQLPRMALLGLLGCALFPYLMYVAAGSTSAMHLGLLQTLLPLMAVVMARLLFGVEIRRAMVVGALLSLFGVALVMAKGDMVMLVRQWPNTGDLVMLAAVACFALYSVLAGRWGSPLSPSVEMLGQALVATLVLLPVWWLSPAGGPVTPIGLGLIAYAGGLASIVAPLLWLRGIGRIGPTRAALYFNLLPVMTAALAIAFLGERLTASLAVGGALTIAGVVIAQSGDAMARLPFSRKRRSPRPGSTPPSAP